MEENAVLDPAWAQAEKPVDPDFKGSVFEKLGLDEHTCPTCTAHLYRDETIGLICLNACHLSPAARDRFNQIWGAIESSGAFDDLFLMRDGGQDVGQA